MTQYFIEDTKSLIGSNHPNRRDFLKLSTFASLGFAIAAQPVHAQAIYTDFDHLETMDISINYGNSQLPAYIAKPKNTSSPLPIIIVVSEIFGVHEYIADVTRRFAKLGYLAVAPDFFYRNGDPQNLGTIAEIMREIISKTSDEQTLTDVQACIDWAIKNGGHPKKIGINGFCWGGRVTWLACEKLDQLKAGVAWYGRLSGDKSINFPNHPIDLLNSIKAPVLGLYGAKDEGIPIEIVEEMKRQLRKNPHNSAALKSRLKIYGNAGHAFHADYRMSYVKEAAIDGWNLAINWFKENGVI